MILGEHPLDEIAVAPSFIRGITVIEVGVLLTLTTFESFILTSLLIKATEINLYVLAVSGLAYGVIRTFLLINKVGRLKRDMPRGLFVYWLQRQFIRHTNINFLAPVCGTVFFSGVAMSFLFLFFGYGLLGFLIGSLIGWQVVKAKYGIWDVFSIESKVQTGGDLICSDLVFETSRTKGKIK